MALFHRGTFTASREWRQEMERQNVGRIVALCGVQGCCPTAEFTQEGVVLRDDHNGQMKLTEDEWAGFSPRPRTANWADLDGGRAGIVPATIHHHTQRGGPVTGGEMNSTRGRYRADGYCVSGPLLDESAIAQARLAAGRVIAGCYETGVKPLYRNWNLGDPPQSLVKIDLPHLSDRMIQRVVSDHRIGEWVAGLLDARLVQMWACELICKFPQAEPLLAQDGAVGWRQDDHSFRHWAGEICTVWLALVDVDTLMGPVRYARNSGLEKGIPDDTNPHKRHRSALLPLPSRPAEGKLDRCIPRTAPSAPSPADQHLAKAA
jgi:hypothetical protein